VVRLLTTSKARLTLLFLLTFLVLTFSFRPVGAAVTRFCWLKAGTYAFYPFERATFGFDDCGQAEKVRGNYSWTCLGKNDTYAVLSVAVNIEVYQLPEWTTPGFVCYYGIDVVRRAESGDLSFIRRVPMDQVVGRVSITDSAGEYCVSVPSPVVISKNLTVTVDLDTMMMVDENGKAWGKWIMWINPLKYPLQGSKVEPYIMNWLNTTVDVNVTYVPNSLYPEETALGTTSRAFAACFWDTLDPNLLLNITSFPSVMISNDYEPRTGVLLRPTGTDYLDDVLTQKFGVAVAHLWAVSSAGHYEWLFYLNDTNISTGESDSGSGSSSYPPFLPYLAIPSAGAIVTAAYVVRRKGRKKKDSGGRSDR
jgi:hypothetical protein